MHIIQSEISQERSKIMNFYKRRYQLILRYLYTETIKCRGEISLHIHFNINITSSIILKRINSLLMQIINSFLQNSNNVLFYILQFQAFGTSMTANRRVMAKTYKVVDPFKPTTPDQEDTQHDWNKCIWCQEDTSESLTCPADSKRGTDGSGYRTTAEIILAFEKLGCLPRKMNLSQLDEGVETCFRYHRAKWHDSCRLKFNKSKLQRAEKRKAISQDNCECW